MDRLRAMQVFVRVVERNSFVRAAEELGYSHGMASSIVKDLERHLGVELLRRTTRRLSLTEDGQRYFDSARGILGDIAELEDDVGSSEKRARGTLRVQIPVGLSRMVVAPALPGFIEPFPELGLQLLSRNGFPDFVGDNIDAAVFIGEPPEQNIIARPLGRIPFITSASPDYLKKHGVPQTPDELIDHECIGIISSGTGNNLDWRFEEQGIARHVATRGRLAFESSEAAVAAAVAGGGVLQMIAFLVAEDIAAGRLKPVLDDWLYPGAMISLIYPKQARMPRKVRVFETFLRETMRRYSRLWQADTKQ